MLGAIDQGSLVGTDTYEPFSWKDVAQAIVRLENGTVRGSMPCPETNHLSCDHALSAEKICEVFLREGVAPGTLLRGELTSARKAASPKGDTRRAPHC